LFRVIIGRRHSVKGDITPFRKKFTRAKNSRNVLCQGMTV
jgi:hypothetical protein